jgi:hypothetical protein
MYNKDELHFLIKNIVIEVLTTASERAYESDTENAVSGSLPERSGEALPTEESEETEEDSEGLDDWDGDDEEGPDEDFEEIAEEITNAIIVLMDDKYLVKAKSN